MNKSKYVDKMTDLVEEVLVDMGVSPIYTIVDNWDEEEELSMTLLHDANEHSIEFNLEDLYTQKQEEDVKIKHQFRDAIKSRVVAFVNAEQELGIDEDIDEEEEYDEDYEDEDYEEDEEYEDDEYDDEYDDEDEDEDEDEEEEYDEDDYDDEEDDYDEEEELSQDEILRRRFANITSKTSGSYESLRFSKINEAGNVLASTLPKNIRNENLTRISQIYKNQLSDLFEEGAYITKPNATDVLVFDMSEFDEEGVSEILENVCDNEEHMEIVGIKDGKIVFPEQDAKEME